MKRFLWVSCIVLLASLTSFADTILYGNNATFGTPYIYQFDANTGAILNTYTNLSGNNGRGVVVVNNIMYYTTAGDANVYKYDLSTNTNLGVAFTVAGASALSTMAFDGTNFWIGDYSGTNQAYLYTPTGTLLKTISLANCTGFCDGLEFFLQSGQGRLISNEGDGGGPYDVYDTNGNLLTTSFINPGAGAFTTGIAFDGTDFFTSNPLAGTISEWNAIGTFVGTVALTGGSPLIEDLSANYAQVLPPPVPEPSSLILLGSGLVGLAGILRRRLVK